MNLKLIRPERVDYLVVHCSATRPSQDIGAAEIDRMHRMRGFFKIGYHYVIRRDGSVEVGRKVFDDGSAEPGAHYAMLNDRSIGICLIGGVTEADVTVPEQNFTAAQFQRLRTLLQDLDAIYPFARVIGHGDPVEDGERRPLAKKACPSFDVRKWLVAGGSNPPTRR